MVTIICQFCGQGFDHEPFFVGGSERFRPTACSTCILSEEEKARDEASERKERRLNSEWDDICPALFKGTDESRIPAKFRNAANGWKFQSRGIGFTGEAGLCKTRSAFLLLRRHHFAGRKCAAVTSMEIGRLAVDQFHKDPDKRAYAARDLAELKQRDIILIDDLGKGKMTERAEVELFDILNHRTSHMLPTIWTANASGDDLAAMISEDRREPILRRLAEFSDIL